MFLVPVSVQETFAGGGLRVIVHGNGEACVSSSNENLGCRQIGSQGTFEFDGSPDTFRACLNGSCQSGSNSPASAPEHVFFGSGGGGSSGGFSGGGSSGDWTLRVDLTQTTFGTERATVTLKGPFGYQDTRSVQTGPSVSVSFSVPGSAIPPGYNYEVCVSGSILSAILPNCQFRPHGSGDESISMEIPG